MNHSLVGKTAAANMCERINKLIRNFERAWHRTKWRP